MKVIFLDIDGVLNSFDDPCPDPSKYKIGILYSPDLMWNADNISVKYMRQLNEIVEKTDAKVVISSSWRRNNRGDGLTLDELKKVFATKGFTGDIFGVTPRLYRDLSGKAQTRADEIAAWLSSTDQNVESYVILDDGWEGYLIPKFGNNFILIEQSCGLQQSHVDKAIQILGAQNDLPEMLQK